MRGDAGVVHCFTSKNARKALDMDRRPGKPGTTTMGLVSVLRKLLGEE
jgi:hypothetical protein